MGSVARYVGNLDALLDDRDRAEPLLRRALETHERMRAPTWAARTKLDLARLLADGGRAGEARQLAAAATALASRHQAHGVECRARALLATVE